MIRSVIFRSAVFTLHGILTEAGFLVKEADSYNVNTMSFYVIVDNHSPIVFFNSVISFQHPGDLHVSLRVLQSLNPQSLKTPANQESDRAHLLPDSEWHQAQRKLC